MVQHPAIRFIRTAALFLQQAPKVKAFKIVAKIHPPPSLPATMASSYARGRPLALISIPAPPTVPHLRSVATQTPTMALTPPFLLLRRTPDHQSEGATGSRVIGELGPCWLIGRARPRSKSSSLHFPAIEGGRSHSHSIVYLITGGTSTPIPIGVTNK
jgi:hypothetical protein